MDLRATYDGHEILHGIGFEMPAGGLHAILGPSGCGKTTLLRCVAGLKSPDGGRVLVDGDDVTRAPPDRRGIVLLHQENTLFPHLDVRRNVAFGFRFRRLDGSSPGRRVADLLGLVGLPASHAGRRIHQLSGGERQRVALARALAVEPRVLLLDEPLAHLDAPLRATLRGDLRRILRDAHATALYVTHDREEAFALADRVLLLDAGHVVDEGAPVRVFERPATAHAARLLGRRNILSYRRTPTGTTETPIGPLAVDLPRGAPPSGSLMLREEDLRLVRTGPGPEVVVTTTEYLGGRHLVRVQAGQVTLYVEETSDPGLRTGDAVRLDATRARIVAWPAA